MAKVLRIGKGEKRERESKKDEERGEGEGIDDLLIRKAEANE